MNRCSNPLPTARGLLAGALLAGLALLHAPASAQMQRLFPQQTQRGTLEFSAPPEVLLDGRAETLGPGTRVFDERNMGVLPGFLVGQVHAVNYQRDAAGVIRQIWILTPAERDASEAGAGDMARPQLQYLN